MPILFNCKCGKKVKTRDDLAGKKVKCPGCGKAIKVPIPAPKPSEELDLLPMEEERLPANVPEKPAPQDKLPPPPSTQTRRCPNPKCNAELYPGDVICLNCGTQVGKLKGRTQRKVAWHEQPLVRLGITIVALVVIGITVYINFFKPKPEEDNHEPVSPDEVLLQELNDAESTNFESLAKALARTPVNALKISFEEYQKGEFAKRLKAAQGMVMLAYYGRFNQRRLYLNLVEKSRDQHTSIKIMLADLFYLIATSEPDYELIEHNEEIKKCAKYFKGDRKNEIIKEAKNPLRKFAYDDNEFLRAKGLAALISLGDLNRLEKLGELLDSPDTSLKIKVTSLIFSFTGQSFENRADWETWWENNKSLRPKEWKKQPKQEDKKEQEEEKQ